MYLLIYCCNFAGDHVALLHETEANDMIVLHFISLQSVSEMPEWLCG